MARRSKKELEELKASLPKFGMAQIAKEMGIPRSSVYRVLTGVWYNWKIVKKAKFLVEKYKIRKEKKPKKIIKRQEYR
jgi:predicted transcriptional regulator